MKNCNVILFKNTVVQNAIILLIPILKAKIEKAVDHICLKLSIKDDFEIKYVKNTALNLVPRIEAAVSNNDLQNIFLSFRSQEEEIMLLKYYLDNNGNDNPSNTGWENKFKELLDK